MPASGVSISWTIVSNYSDADVTQAVTVTLPMVDLGGLSVFVPGGTLPGRSRLLFTLYAQLAGSSVQQASASASMEIVTAPSPFGGTVSVTPESSGVIGVTRYALCLHCYYVTLWAITMLRCTLALVGRIL
jgi:hypothetical protein